MQFKKLLLAVTTLIFTVSAWAQDPKISKSLKSCVRDGATSRLTIKNGKLECDAQGSILWIESLETTNARSGVVHTNITIDEINKILGKVSPVKALTVNANKVRDNSGYEDDVYKNGTDLSIDTFIITQVTPKVVQKKADGQYAEVEFKDNESGVNKEDEAGNDVNISASFYSFFPFIVYDGATSSQTILQGAVNCSKPIRKFGNTWGRKKRVYVESTTPAQYCYANTLGIDLPAGFKSGEKTSIGFKIIVPYSQQGPSGQEDDIFAIWPAVTKSQYDATKNILLTSPRGLVFLTKNPVKIEN